MYGLSGLGSIKDDLILIVVLSVVLAILLTCEHLQKKLGKRQEYLEDFIYDMGMFIKRMYKRWRKIFYK